MQNYPNLEILVSDNCSTDNTYEIVQKEYPEVRLVKTEYNNGGGPNMDNCVRLAEGSIIVFLCSDDIFTDPNVISDIARMFELFPKVGYVGHWYYQFLDPDPKPVRIHRSLDPYFQADNQSGIAFRKEAIKGNFAPTYWIEGASMVKRVLDDGWDYKIIRYDTVGIRIHPGGNTSTRPEPYIVSPTLTWLKLVGRRKFFLTAFISLVQYKNWGKYRYMLREIWYFIILKPSNLFRPDFWFWSLIAIFTPKCILRPFTQGYKKHFLKLFIMERSRCEKIY
jgi:glycosyltransferase involved in cell wall biosynthesis